MTNSIFHNINCNWKLQCWKLQSDIESLSALISNMCCTNIIILPSKGRNKYILYLIISGGSWKVPDKIYTVKGTVVQQFTFIIQWTHSDLTTLQLFLLLQVNTCIQRVCIFIFITIPGIREQCSWSIYHTNVSLADTSVLLVTSGAFWHNTYITRDQSSIIVFSYVTYVGDIFVFSKKQKTYCTHVYYHNGA